MDASAYGMWFLIGGMVILLVSSILQSYWEFGRDVKPDLRPAVFETSWRHVMLVGWVILLLVGGTLVLLATMDWRVCLAAIAVYYLLLPLSVGPRVRRRALPPWEDLQHDLEKEGYAERNYWRRGDWWKEESKRRKPKSRTGVDERVRRLERGKDHHRILGVSKDASQEEITQAYRGLVKRYHSDHGEGNEEWANERLKEINEAYEALREMH